jgi:hypothetical protein
MTTRKATTTTKAKVKAKTKSKAKATGIEKQFPFSSLSTEGVVYERGQGSDQGEESGCSGVVGG